MQLALQAPQGAFLLRVKLTPPPMLLSCAIVNTAIAYNMTDVCAIETRLQHWARWKHKSGEHLGYKNKASFLALLPMGAISYDPAIDSYCQEVNNAVEDLPTLHQMIIRHEYLIMTTETLDQRADLFGMKKSAYRHWLNDAYKKLAAALNIQLEKPEEILA